MLDWPEHTQISPDSTLSICTVLLPVMVMVCGPPAGGVCSRTIQLPSAPATAFADWPQLPVTVIVSSGSAHPHTGACVSRWITMPLVNRAGSLTSACAWQASSVTTAIQSLFRTLMS